MVDATKACESDFMTSDLVTNSPTKKVVIVSGGEYVKGKFGEKLELKVTLDKKLKTWSPNRESCQNMKDAFGTETEGWMSQVIHLTLKLMDNGKLGIIGIPADSIPKPIPVVEVDDPNFKGKPIPVVEVDDPNFKGIDNP